MQIPIPERGKMTVTLAACLFLAGSVFAAEETEISTELDALWAEISLSVAEGDFDAYAATYHPDAVLVNIGSASSEPIAVALTNWKPGFDDTKSGNKTAGVSFRFTQRLLGSTTAHETGMFHFWSQPDQGQLAESFVHFEALSVKKDGEWKMIMEYQKEHGAKDDWDAIGESH